MRLFSHAVATVVTLVSLALRGSCGEISPQDLGEGRQAVTDLWTHTEGPPRGHKVSLELPDSDSVEVAKIVAAKKIEIAAAGLHHAMENEKQSLERKMRSDEENETEVTRAKIADTKVNRIRDEMKTTDARVEQLKNKQGDLLVKVEEAKAEVEMASEKKKKEKTAVLKLQQAKATNLDMKLTAAKTKLQKLSMDVVGAKEEYRFVHKAHDETRLKNVALRVKLHAAKEATMHAQFMALKSKNLKKLASAKFAKENFTKKQQHARNDVIGATEMLGIMSSGPGKKEATASLQRAKERHQDMKKKRMGAIKDVAKTKQEINDNEVKWAQKVAYKAVMRTAVLAAAANKADTAVASSLSEADKMGKSQAAELAHTELARAEEIADKESRNAEHTKFAATQDNEARAIALKEEQEKIGQQSKLQEKRKKESELAKAALSGTGKPGR